MDGVISVGDVGAGLSQAKFRMHTARSLKDQPNVAKALGVVALELVRSVMANTNQATQQHDLDVKA
ncbi:MAG: hypothetical protein NTU83_11225 [Candidatus Hydrogenedentes bacterium]|nr:hypothetical protein [Candidatus Hydrogenedentota bacterium]